MTFSGSDSWLKSISTRSMARAAHKEEIVNTQKQNLAIVLMSMIWLLASCGQGADGSHDRKNVFYPLDLALACDQSTPTPLRNQYPVRDSDGAFGNECAERDAGVAALSIARIEIRQNERFREPLYEVWLRIDGKDQKRLLAFMSKAVQSHRMLLFVVHGAVVSRASVMGLPPDGVITLGGYTSVEEAEAAAARFGAPVHRRG
jgi:hypothetical protein